MFRLIASSKLGWVGFVLSLGLVGIALIVGIVDQDLPFSIASICKVYNNPVQWIILTSPVFLTLVFHFLGSGLHARELKLKQRAVHEEEQFHTLEKFIEQLGDGNYAATLSDSFDNPSLSKKLDAFREKLIRNRDDEQRRAWEKEGLARFAEIVRSKHNVEELSDAVTRYLVNYTDCNQGAMFIAREREGDIYLERTACFAYDRKKFGEVSIPAGTGLIGQCFLEKETTLLYQVPQNYTRITSGLGEATPSCVVIVPMKINEVVNGVIEFASFKKLEQYQIRFLEKACEAIASVLESAMTSGNVKKLLQESQQQTEQMRVQEEEMRQTMEEMQSLQEQMSRQLADHVKIKKELEEREKVLSHTTILSETDPYGTITYVNSKFCEVAQYHEHELLGKPHNIVRHSDMPREVFHTLWKTIKAGKVFHGIVKNRKKDGTHYWVDATIVPVIENGAIVKYIGSRYHITDEEMAEKLFEEQNVRLGIRDTVLA